MASSTQARHLQAEDSPSLADAGNRENACEDRDIISDCPTLHRDRDREGALSTKRKKKQPGGFNLRKSIAWNPAFFSEEGVLDNMELSMLSGSQLKANRSLASGVAAGTISPLCRFGKLSGNSSVLKEVAENSRGKLPAKFHNTDNKGRRLFSSAKTSERDERRELAGTQDKRSARSIQKCIPRPPAGHSQKKEPNPSAQISRTPKKSQSSFPTAPRSTSSVTHISNSNKKLPPVKTEHTQRVKGFPLKSKIKPTSLTKSSGPNIEKDTVPAVAAICEEANDSGKCESFSTYSENRPSSSVVVPASTFAKPSALRMPSPSVGFFTQGKASVSHGDTAQGNAASCFNGNTPLLVKPPRYKQPDDLKSRYRLTKQLPTNCSASSKLFVQPINCESTLNTLDSSFPELEHANVFSVKESLSKGIITYSEKSGYTNNQEMPELNCFSAGSGAATQTFSSEKNDGSINGMPDVYNDASLVEEKDIINNIKPVEDSLSLEAICSSNIKPVEESCSYKAIYSSTKPIVGSNFSSSCISSQLCTPVDINCESKSDACASAAIDLETSLVGETVVAVSLSEGNSCTPGPDFLGDYDSCNQQNTECSNLIKSTICASQVPQCASSIEIKPALDDSTSDLNASLCTEARPTSSEEPNVYGGMEIDSDNSSTVNKAHLLHVGFECDHGYRITECSPMKPAAAPPMPRVDQETQAVDLSDLKAVTIDRKIESHDSLTVEGRLVLSEEPKYEDNMELDTNKLSAIESASHIGKIKSVDKPGTNTILKDHLKHLVPFTEEWLAAMEACGEEVLEQKSGAVQNSPTDKTAPEPSPWSPVKRKAQDVGPFDCTKYSKSVRTSDTP